MPVPLKRLVLIGAAAALAVSAPLVAQNAMQTPGAPDPARVAAGTYQADPNHTMVEWEVDHLGFTPYFGIFGDVTGTLVLDPADLGSAKVDVTIPVSKVTTASAELTQHLLRAPKEEGGKPDFFGPAPADAHFVSTSVVQTGPEKAQITGDLSLNGVTRPVTLLATFYGAGTMPPQMGGAEVVGFKAIATIKRSDFGVDGFIPLVSDEVKLDIVAAFTK